MARSFDAICAHLVIVNIRAIFLVWINIHKNEPGTLSWLFYECSEDNKIICRVPDFEYTCSKLQTNIEKVQKKGIKRKNLNHAFEDADNVLLEQLICWLLTSIKSIFSTRGSKLQKQPEIYNKNQYMFLKSSETAWESLLLQILNLET